MNRVALMNLSLIVAWCMHVNQAWADESEPESPKPLKLAPFEEGSLLMLQVTDSRKEMVTWQWCGKKVATPTGQSLRLVEVENGELKPKAETYDELRQEKNRIQFVSHVHRAIVQYTFSSEKMAEGAFAWTLPADWLEGNSESRKKSLGSYRRVDGRVATVQSIYATSTEQDEFRGIRISAFANKPKPGDVPIVKEMLILPASQGKPTQVEAFLNAPPPSTKDYKVYHAFLSKP